MDLHNETPVKYATPVCWALVADGNRARLFAGRIGAWELVESFEHMGSLKRSGDVLAEPSPRRVAAPRFAIGTRLGLSITDDGPQIQAETAASEFEAQRFARELAARLERGVTERAFGDLIIVAPLGFLASLQRSLSLEVQRRVKAYIGSKFASHTETDARRLLDAELASSVIERPRQAL